MDIESGYFFITDISGYTAFLTQSELDHAKEILDTLFDSILDNIEPPLTVSNTQGDAILSYAPDRALIQSQPILEVMERIYFDFRRQLELMKLNTTCTCKACVNMSILDLKIFLHHGQYLLQEIGGRPELQGSDVILAHRLMKNSVKDKLGLSGYGLLTAAALEKMAIPGLADEMTEHVDMYENFGEVRGYVYDLRRAWKVERERRRQLLTPEEAVAWAEAFVPVPPWIAWDYLTHTDAKKRIWDLETHERSDGGKGRKGVGTSFHCQHRLADVEYVITDLEAPSYYSYDQTALGWHYPVTVQVLAAEGGSIFRQLYGAPREGRSEELAAIHRQVVTSAVRAFADLIDEELQSGRISQGMLQSAEAARNAFERPVPEDGRYVHLGEAGET